MNGKERDFFEIWDEFNHKGFADKKWGEGMVRRLEILKMHLKNIHKKHKVGFNSIDEKFYHSFLNYHYKQGFNTSYAVRNLELFRWFMNWASVEGYNQKMKYRKFKPPVDGKISHDELFLSEAELQKLFRLETYDSTLETVKDMFCLSCLTGMRYSDIIKLESSNFAEDRIVIYRSKPAMKLEIPLTGIARDILDKYHTFSEGRLFPVISIQDFNKNLKELGKMAGINSRVRTRGKSRGTLSQDTLQKWEVLSSLFARRTFINLGVSKGIGMEVMCELTGNQPGTLMHYYKTGKSRSEEEMQKINIY